MAYQGAFITSEPAQPTSETRLEPTRLRDKLPRRLTPAWRWGVLRSCLAPTWRVELCNHITNSATRVALGELGATLAAEQAQNTFNSRRRHIYILLRAHAAQEQVPEAYNARAALGCAPRVLNAAAVG